MPIGTNRRDVERLGRKVTSCEADDEGADGCAEDDDEFKRLDQDQQVAMHRVCAEDAHQNHHGADDDEHAERPAKTNIYPVRKMPGT